MPKERTLVIIKPDGVASGWSDNIENRYTAAGFRIVEKGQYTFPYETARHFYEEHEGKFFFVGICLAMSSGPAQILILEGEDAIRRVRALNGATDPSKAEPGTIRHDFRSAGGPFNTVHASDSQGAYQREVNILWFNTGVMNFSDHS